MKKPTTLRDSLDQKFFTAVCSRSLVYNACWEDPAVDRRALRIGPDDRMLVITSAGCNVLDYALLGPQRIFAVDANPRQSALLELKVAGIKALEFHDFFAVFGKGHHPRFSDLYRRALRPLRSPWAAVPAPPPCAWRVPPCAPWFCSPPFSSPPSSPLPSFPWVNP